MARRLTIPEPQMSYFQSEEIREILPSVSDHNEFIPLISLREGELISYPNGGKRFLYSLSTPTHEYTNTRRVSNFCQGLFSDFWLRLGRDELNGEYIGFNGMVAHFDLNTTVVTPLMMLCVKRRQLFNLNREHVENSKLCLVIDKSFRDDDKHFKVFRNVNRIYIEELNQLGVDIYFANSLTDTCFNPGPIDLPKFKGIPEMLAHYKTMNDVVRERLKGRL